MVTVPGKDEAVRCREKIAMDQMRRVPSEFEVEGLETYRTCSAIEMYPAGLALAGLCDM